MGGAGQPRDTLALRLLTAAIGLPIVFGAMWLGGIALLLLVALAALVGLLEFRGLTSHEGMLSFVVSGASVLAFLVSAWLGDVRIAAVFAGVLLIGLLVHVLRYPWRGEKSPDLRRWALTIAASVYPGGLLAYGLAIRGLDDGRFWLIAAVALVFASDTGAYFTGKILGRHRMAPRISPGKTWEGAVGGLFWTGVISSLIAVVFDLDIRVEVAAVAAIGVSLLAQIGDLVESYLKRRGEAKDAGHLLPGHGGILDRLDSIVLVLPAVYYGLIWTF